MTTVDGTGLTFDDMPPEVRALGMAYDQAIYEAHVAALVSVERWRYTNPLAALYAAWKHHRATQTPRHAPMTAGASTRTHRRRKRKGGKR